MCIIAETNGDKLMKNCKLLTCSIVMAGILLAPSSFAKPGQLAFTLKNNTLYALDLKGLEDASHTEMSTKLSSQDTTPPIKLKSPSGLYYFNLSNTEEKIFVNCIGKYNNKSWIVTQCSSLEKTVKIGVAGPGRLEIYKKADS